MVFWTDKAGNKLTFAQFISRWKSGIEGLTPAQKMKTQVNGTRLILIGIFLGFVMSLIAWRVMWWVAIILLGAFINTILQYVGQIEQLKILQGIDREFEVKDEN